MLTGAQVLDARKRAGWTQQQLADRVCCTKPAVSNWECGRNAVSGPVENLLRRIFADEGIQISAGAKRVQVRRKGAKVA